MLENANDGESKGKVSSHDDAWFIEPNGATLLSIQIYYSYNDASLVDIMRSYKEIIQIVQIKYSAHINVETLKHCSAITDC